MQSETVKELSEILQVMESFWESRAVACKMKSFLSKQGILIFFLILLPFDTSFISSIHVVSVCEILLFMSVN